jgi:hypothetical protein
VHRWNRHDLREIDGGDHLTGDSDEIDPRDDSVQVDPPDRHVQVDESHHGVQVDAAHHGVQVNRRHQCVEVEACRGRIQVDASHHGVQVHGRHQRVEVDVRAHHLGEVEHGEHGLHCPDHPELQQPQANALQVPADAFATIEDTGAPPGRHHPVEDAPAQAPERLRSPRGELPRARADSQHEMRDIGTAPQRLHSTG